MLFDPALRVFPPAFVVRPEGTAGAEWVRANIDFALAQADASPLGPDAINTRLPEMLLVEVLRQHLATAPAVDRGWLAALHDPVLNPALAALHADARAEVDGHRPGPRRGGVAVRASTSGSGRCSAAPRSATSPSGGCTWPRTCSTSTDLGVAAIARRVGYDAEEAFSRAFKRAHGAVARAVAVAPHPALRPDPPEWCDPAAGVAPR